MSMNTHILENNHKEHNMSRREQLSRRLASTVRSNTPMHRIAWRLLAIVLILAAAPAAHAAIIISEIFYNMDGSEGTGTEWVELYNTGASSVDLTSYTFEDIQDGDATNPFPASSIAGKGTAIVVEQSDATFESIWGPNINVITVTNMPSLANSPDSTNEILAIKDDGGVTLDVVNYDDANGWPSDSPEGVSIYLLPGFLNASDNDDGANWSRSIVGVHGGRQALILNPDIGNADALDVASPGFAQSVPEPSTLTCMLIGLGVLGLGRRPRRERAAG